MLFSAMALVVRIKSSVNDIVEKLSAILPPNCLRRGCSQELISEFLQFCDSAQNNL